MNKKHFTYLIGILLIAGGIYLVISPTKTFANIVYYAGIFVLINGLVKLLSAIINKDGINPDSNLLGSIINIVFGIIIMNNSKAAIEIIPIFIAIWLIISAVLALGLQFKFRNYSLDVKKFASNVCKLVLGLIVLTMPVIPIIFTGWVLGIILIIIGVFTIASYKETDSIYKVKIK